MQKPLYVLLVMTCLGLFGCVSPPKGKPETSVSAKNPPPIAQEYWAKRDTEDKVVRENYRADDFKRSKGNEPYNVNNR